MSVLQLVSAFLFNETVDLFHEIDQFDLYLYLTEWVKTNCN